MIACVVLSSHPSIDAPINQQRGELRREQQMVKPNPLVRLPPLELVVPKSPQRSSRMQLPESVSPTLPEQPRKCFTTGWLHESVLI